jgi:hypothetical protein
VERNEWRIKDYLNNLLGQTVNLCSSSLPA